MADNTTLNPGSGGDTYASDDIGGVKHQRVKIEYGADGSATDVSTASPLPVRAQPAATATATTVAGSATTAVLKASNTARRGLIIRNDSTATLYLGLGVSATTSSPLKVEPGQSFIDVPASYTGAVNGIWSSATGNARVEELT